MPYCTPIITTLPTTSSTPVPTTATTTHTTSTPTTPSLPPTTTPTTLSMSPWASWGAWTECDCGAGLQERRRDGGGRQRRFCIAAADCKRSSLSWGVWGPWSECSATCGLGGLRSRSGPEPCPGCDSTSSPRQEEPCPTPPPCRGEWAEWAEWAEWQRCSATCGGGMRLRERRCLGENCRGADADSEECGSEKNCPGPWGRWTDCTVSCDRGTQYRRRLCFGQVRCLDDCARTELVRTKCRAPVEALILGSAVGVLAHRPHPLPPQLRRQRLQSPSGQPGVSGAIAGPHHSSSIYRLNRFPKHPFLQSILWPRHSHANKGLLWLQQILLHRGSS